MTQNNVSRGELGNIPLRRTHLYKAWHIEKDFQSEVFKYLRNLWIYIHRIPDLWPASRLVDAIMIDQRWQTFYVEFKKVDGYTYNMSQFEPSQIKFFEFASSRNVEAYVMIYSRKTQTYWVGEYRYLKENQNQDWGIKLFSKLL